MQLNLTFDKQFLYEIKRLITPYWRSKSNRHGWLLLIANLACILLGVYTSLALNRFYKHFYNALQAYDTTAIIHSLLPFTLILLTLVISFGYAAYFSGLLSLHWRRSMTHHYLFLQVHQRTHIDNPDQRISEDIALFIEHTVTLLFAFFNGALTLIAFTIVLWRSAAPLTFSFLHHMIFMPFYLLIAAIIYTFLGTLMTHTLGKELSHFDYQEQCYNAHFRRALIDAKTNAEPIEHLKKLFIPVFDNKLSIIQLKKRLTFFTSGYNTLSYLLGILLLLPVFLQKQIQLGDLMQLSGALASIIGASSVLISSYFQLTDWRATAYRLTECGV
jgi:putative ATP-binding cassette transporter